MYKSPYRLHELLTYILMGIMATWLRHVPCLTIQFAAPWDAPTLRPPPSAAKRPDHRPWRTLTWDMAARVLEIDPYWEWISKKISWVSLCIIMYHYVSLCIIVSWVTTMKPNDGQHSRGTGIHMACRNCSRQSSCRAAWPLAFMANMGHFRTTCGCISGYVD